MRIFFGDSVWSHGAKQTLVSSEERFVHELANQRYSQLIQTAKSIGKVLLYRKFKVISFPPFPSFPKDLYQALEKRTARFTDNDEWIQVIHRSEAKSEEINKR